MESKILQEMPNKGRPNAKDLKNAKEFAQIIKKNTL